MTFSPEGLLIASWSKVVTSPPAARILVLALSVTLKAQTLSLGNSPSLTSSVIVPTRAKMVSCPLQLINLYLVSPSVTFFLWTYLASLEREIGALWILELFNLFKTNLLNLDSVLLDRNLYNLTASLWYKLGVFKTLWCLLFFLPPEIKSIP